MMEPEVQQCSILCFKTHSCSTLLWVKSPEFLSCCLCRVFHNSHLRGFISVRIDSKIFLWGFVSEWLCLQVSEFTYAAAQPSPPRAFLSSSLRMAGFPNESRAAFWSARQMEVFITLHLTSFSQQVPIHWSQPYVCPYSFRRHGSELHFHRLMARDSFLF